MLYCLFCINILCSLVVYFCMKMLSENVEWFKLVFYYFLFVLKFFGIGKELGGEIEFVIGDIELYGDEIIC